MVSRVTTLVIHFLQREQWSAAGCFGPLLIASRPAQLGVGERTR